MSGGAWVGSIAWLAAACGVALARGARARREGRFGLVVRRLRSPTPYLFAAYLLVAGLVTPRSAGETTSPLLALALSLPALYALATASAAGSERPRPALSAALALLHGGSVLACAAVVLATVSPGFVPAWLR